MEADYLNTFTAGSHNIEIVWTDGSASTEFTIQEHATDSNTQSSQTAGNSRTRLWTTLLFVWIAGLLVFITLIVGLIVNGNRNYEASENRMRQHLKSLRWCKIPNWLHSQVKTRECFLFIENEEKCDFLLFIFLSNLVERYLPFFWRVV